MPKRRTKVSQRNTARSRTRVRRRMQRNPATLVYNDARGNATVDVYMLGRDKYEIDVANDSRKHTYAAPTRDSAISVAREKLHEYAVQNPERRRNGIFSNLFGTHETYHSRIVRTGGSAGSSGSSKRARKTGTFASPELSSASKATYNPRS